MEEGREKQEAQGNRAAVWNSVESFQDTELGASWGTVRRQSLLSGTNVENTLVSKFALS